MLEFFVANNFPFLIYGFFSSHSHNLLHKINIRQVVASDNFNLMSDCHKNVLQQCKLRWLQEFLLFMYKSKPGTNTTNTLSQSSIFLLMSWSEIILTLLSILNHFDISFALCSCGHVLGFKFVPHGCYETSSQ